MLHVYDGEQDRSFEVHERNLANIKVVHTPFGSTMIATPTEILGVPGTAVWSLQPGKLPQKSTVEVVADSLDTEELTILVNCLREGLSAGDGKTFSRPGAAKGLMKKFQALLKQRT